MKTIYYFDEMGKQLGTGESFTVPDNATDTQPPTPEAVWDGTHWVGQTLVDIAKIKGKEINNKAQEAIDSVIEPYPDFEKLTFERQEREARAFLVDNTISTPTLSPIAQARGLSVEELATRVVAKADGLVGLAAHIAGQRQAYQYILATAVDTEDQVAVESINISYLLPS